MGRHSFTLATLIATLFVLGVREWRVAGVGASLP